MPHVLRRLLELVESKEGSVAVKACEIILNRAYGRAPINVNIAHSLTDQRLLEDTARRILLKRAGVAVDPPIAPSGYLGVRSGSPPNVSPEATPEDPTKNSDEDESELY